MSDIREWIGCWFYYKVSATHIPKENIVAWERLNESSKEFYKKEADSIISYLKSQIEQMENPFSNLPSYDRGEINCGRERGYKNAIQDILSKL